MGLWRDHDAAWKGQEVPGASGLTPFQERCEALLLALLNDRNVNLRDREVVGRTWNYIHGYLGDTAWEVWIYRDQAELSRCPGKGGCNLEQWDAPAPDELIRMYLAHINRALDDTGS